MLGFPPLLMPSIFTGMSSDPMCDKAKLNPEIDLDTVERTEEQRIGDEIRKIHQIPVYFDVWMWHTLLKELEYLKRIQNRDSNNIDLVLTKLNEQLSDVGLKRDENGELI
jgi:hypothetical protein